MKVKEPTVEDFFRITSSLMPDEYELVGPSEVAHFVEGGNYDDSDGALHTDIWESLSNIAVLVTLIQGVYFTLRGINQNIEEHKKDPRAALEVEVKKQIKIETVKEVKRKYNIEIESSDKNISDEMIESITKHLLLEDKE